MRLSLLGYTDEDIEEWASLKEKLGNTYRVYQYLRNKKKIKISPATVYKKLNQFKKKLSIEELLELKRDLNSRTLLKEEFWEAFKKGWTKYSPQNLSYLFEYLGELMKDKGFVDSFLLYNYLINILTVQEGFFISVHTTGTDNVQVGNLNYNLQNKRCELYYINRRALDNPKALQILYKLRRETLAHGIELEEKCITNTGAISFEGPLNILKITGLWSFLIKLRNFFKVSNNSYHNIIKTTAEYIASKIKLDPFSVAAYGRLSPLGDVKHEAIIAYNILYDEKSEVTKLWKELILNHPELSSIQKAESISEKINISALTIAGIARVSENKIVKKEAIDAYFKLYAILLDLEERWSWLIKTHPNYSAEQRIRQLAKELDLNPSTIVIYGHTCKNEDIKKDISSVKFFFFESFHKVSELWNGLILNRSELTPLEKVKNISRETRLSILTTINYAFYSSIKGVRSEAWSARYLHYDEKYNLNKKWLNLMKKSPSDSSSERARKISKDLNISPFTITINLTCSKNLNVRRDARTAHFHILDEKHEITSIWSSLIKKIPTVNSFKRARKIAQLKSLNIFSVCSIGRYSQSPLIRKDARAAITIEYDRRLKITEKWVEIYEKDNLKDPEFIARHLAKKLKKSPSTIAYIAAASPNKIIRSQASIARNRLVDDQYGITSLWLSYMGKHEPDDIAIKIGKKLKMSPLNISKIMISSKHKLIKKEASIASFRLFIKRYNLEETFIHSIEDNLELEPKEILISIAQTHNLSLSTLLRALPYSQNIDVREEVLRIRRLCR